MPFKKLEMPDINSYWPEEHDEALIKWQAEVAQTILEERNPEVAQRVLDRAHEKAVPNPEGTPVALSITSYSDIGPRNLAIILYQYLGNKVLDLAYALLASADRTTNDDRNLDSAQKQLKIEDCARIQMSETKCINTISWALGDTFINDQLKRGTSDVGEILKTTLTLIATKEEMRRKLMEAAKVVARGRDAGAAWSIGVEGHSTLRDIDQITEYEWWENLRASQSPLGYQIEGFLSKIEPEDGVQTMTSFAVRELAIKKFFEDHKEPMEAKKLREVLECKKHREELVKLRSEYNQVAVAAKEAEIINRVYSEVSKYKRRKMVGEEMPDYERGLPVNLLETRDVTCFGAPWLIATMLMECGIQPENLLYCATNITYGGIIGSHGSLAVKTNMNDLIFVDIMAEAPRQIPLAVIENAQDVDPLVKFLNGLSNHPARITFEESLATSLKMHPHMYIMPLEEGLASGHMLHIGLSFFHEKKYEEAKYAFKLALDLNPKDTDSAYYLGIIACQEGDITLGKKFFKKAIEFFDQYMLAHFALAEVALAEGNREEALARLYLVVGNQNEIYADQTLTDRAKGLLINLMKKTSEMDMFEEKGIRDSVLTKLSNSATLKKLSEHLGGNIKPRRIWEIVGMKYWKAEQERKRALVEARKEEEQALV